MRRTWSMVAVVVFVGAGLAACSDDSSDEGASPTTQGASTSAAATTSAAAATTTEPASTAPESTEPESSEPESSEPESSTSTAPPTTTGGLLDAPVEPVPPLYDEADVRTAVDQLDDIVAEAQDRTGVPGIAIAVVYKDEVIYAEGFGVRRVGEDTPVDPDTVFQVASVSKTVATTIVAHVVGEGTATWTDPAVTWNPDFALNDPYVTANATISDLLSHRTGLPGSSGDLLEDLGWDRDYILGAIAQQPLQPFRSTYDYSNFGITAGAITAADAAGAEWEDLADSALFDPLGMNSSSYRHADFLARDNRAAIHFPVGPLTDKVWEPRFADLRNADAEAPAGGLSTSVNDMAQFLRLQLGQGTVDGTEVVDATALQVTHVPHIELSQPTTPGVRTQFYGLGWNVTTDDEGRVRLDHSGAFFLGAATNVMLYETEDLGIVTLTNGQPHGVPEAINNFFFDVATHGQPTVDWLDFWDTAFNGLYEAVQEQETQYATPPASPTPPAADLNVYAGTFQNSYYGPLTVAVDGGTLYMSMGLPASPTRFDLTAYDGDSFTFDTVGENASGKSLAAFTVGPDGAATSVNLAFYDETGLGTFTRQ